MTHARGPLVLPGGILFLLALVGLANAQPKTESVVNGASFEPLVSSGLLVSTFGTELAESTVAASSVPLPTNLNGVTVLFDGVEAPLYFVSEGQINAQIPFGLAADKVEVVVGTPEGRSEPLTCALLPAAPGIFTLDSDGKGTPILLSPAFAVLPTAAPSQRLILYATGLGETAPAALTGTGGSGEEPFNRVVDLPEVYIGGRQAEVEFAGLAPGFVGVYQLNVVAPDEFVNDNVFVISGGRRSNLTEITASTPNFVRGSGVVVSEVRETVEFDRIQLFAVATVDVEVGQEATPLRIEGEDNLIGLVSAQVRDGALQITSSRPYTTNTAVVISVTTPALKRLEYLGVGNFEVTGLSGGTFEAFMSGVGNVMASGSVDSLDVLLLGVGNIALLDLASSRTRALLLSVGNVEVNATESLFARVHGVGDITYTGNPAELDMAVNGFGDIRPQ